MKSAPVTGEPNGATHLRRLAALFLVAALVFFPLIMNPLIVDFFDADTDAERLTHVQNHLGALRLVFTGMGVTEVALGFSLWLWGRSVAEQTPGRRAITAQTIGRVALAAGFVALANRLTAWIDNAESLASTELTSTDLVFGVLGGGGLSIAFVTFGYLMIRGAMPTWLGALWIVCGVMFWVGILPLWFFLGALVFGIRGVIRYRSGSATAEQISAVPGETATDVPTPSPEVVR